MRRTLPSRSNSSALAACIAAAVVSTAVVSVALAQAPGTQPKDTPPAGTPATSATAAPAPSGAASGAPVSGEAVFRRVCATCHLGLAQIEGGNAGTASALDAHAVPREFLRRYPPQAILTALVSGKMQAQGVALSDAERRAVAEFASGRSFTPAAVVPISLPSTSVPVPLR